MISKKEKELRAAAANFSENSAAIEGAPPLSPEVKVIQDQWVAGEVSTKDYGSQAMGVVTEKAIRLSAAGRVPRAPKAKP